MLHPLRWNRHWPVAVVLWPLLSVGGLAAEESSSAPASEAVAFVDARPNPQLLTDITSGLKCREPLARTMLLAAYGGNRESQQAVADGLAWIVAHQQVDGSWSFDHTQAKSCQGQCTGPGTLVDTYNASTAMALLPLLGAGHTHKEGPHREAIGRGLDYLINQIQATPMGGSLHESGGMMYAHGLAAMALCEAYAMTGDKKLRTAAQKTIDYIVSAQDPVGGGWRYQPRQPGDTSVFGWQRAALYAGQLGGLEIPKNTLQRAGVFLDGVENPGGTYGYTQPGDGPATTAIGLLGRMFQGRPKDHKTFQQGVRQLDQWGPSGTNLYYDYYATQVMRNYGGDSWEAWNKKVRDALVASQEKEGHAAGSWFGPYKDAGVQRGGRLYCTSLAILTLEVYYRYPPIYSAPQGKPAHGGLLGMSAE